MSRNQPPSSSSRYKISSPQPYISAETRSAAESVSRHPQPSLSHTNGPSKPSGSTGTSPARPARSRMREQPPPPAPSSRRELAPLLTPDQLGLAASSGQGHDLPLSPISPMAAGGETLARLADPFAADRSQRSELRAQAAVQQTSSPHVGGSGGEANNKLRNVVGAFISASRAKDDQSRRLPRNKAREEEHGDLWQVNDGGKFVEIDQVLRNIRRDWPFVLESDFSPSSLALSLLSETRSSRPSLPSFLSTHESLSSALQASVQAHFQTFAASLPAHASYLSTLARAQGQIKSSKETLREARDGFGGKGKAELASVRVRERQVRDMLRILDTM